LTSQKLNLNRIDTRPPEGMDEKKMKKKTKKLAKDIAFLQEQFYANSDRSMLVVLQGMDSSGKDGTTREIFRYASPNGVKVTSYKKPTEEEFGHDFLWRIHKNTPKKGHIAVFNRSHYEDILIQYVHGWIDDQKRDERMAAINAFERLLANDANTIIVKLYLHL
jgi:polyphosphate kinase 2 (PPK2 family)